MKLTKLERYTIYCIMLQEAEMRTISGIRTNETINGLCSMFRQLTDCDSLYYFPKETLPEMYKIFGRKGSNHLRFVESWNERAAALQQCINETHP